MFAVLKRKLWQNCSRGGRRQECRDGFKGPHPAIFFSVDHSIGSSFVDATLREGDIATKKTLLLLSRAAQYIECCTRYCSSINYQD